MCESKLYTTNDTMQFIGKQYCMNICNKEYYNQLKDILAGHLSVERFDCMGMLIDVFVLGYIAGQRKERARKAARGGSNGK